ncbi:MAG: 50S ribosomal protein L25 [Chlamydiae bacterium]|nr:50S ribosomal protein L25 [Chlamydiota bacterium]
MKLTAKKRVGETKGATKQARRDGSIPAVFYSPGKPGQSIEIDTAQFEAALRSIKQGYLSTTVFSLDLDEKKTKALVKDVQYDRTTYRVIHLDFMELVDDTPVTVLVPIECVGQEECAGIKLGGFLRQVIRKVKVKCAPKDIPTDFKLDIRDLKMRQSKRLSDLAMPKGVKPMTVADEVVAVIAKR